MRVADVYFIPWRISGRRVGPMPDGTISPGEFTITMSIASGAWAFQGLGWLGPIPAFTLDFSS